MKALTPVRAFCILKYDDSALSAGASRFFLISLQRKRSGLTLIGDAIFDVAGSG
jgi:hypothetical protein|tara:strand:+ start:1682 stop:1843 length:162 start_codon:yes stop_codon:yes gene_type:complete